MKESNVKGHMLYDCTYTILKGKTTQTENRSVVVKIWGRTDYKEAQGNFRSRWKYSQGKPVRETVTFPVAKETHSL